MSDRHEGTSREELIGKAVETMCARRHDDIVPIPDSPNPRLRIAACFDCQRTAEAALDAVLPLIEADVRERLAKEIEALESFAHGKNDKSKTFLIGYGTAKRRAARIVRGDGR